MGTAYEYRYAPITGNEMYCIPEKGTTVTLYFPNDEEENAIVTSCVRTNAETDENMSDPETKRFTTKSGEGFILGRNEARFTGKSVDNEI